jgi:hypothetical protein
MAMASVWRAPLLPAAQALPLTPPRAAAELAQNPKLLEQMRDTVPALFDF